MLEIGLAASVMFQWNRRPQVAIRFAVFYNETVLERVNRLAKEGHLLLRSIKLEGSNLYLVAEGKGKRFEILVPTSAAQDLDVNEKIQPALSLKLYHSRPHWTLPELDRLGLPRFWNLEWLETTTKGLGGLEYVAKQYNVPFWALEQFVNAMYLGEEQAEIKPPDVRSWPVAQQKHWAVRRYKELREKRVKRPIWHMQQESGLHRQDLSQWIEEARRFRLIK